MDSILSKIAEYTIEPIGRLLGRQVCYAIHCKTNLQKLKDQVEELQDARWATENQVAEAERRGERIQPDVQSWLKNVDEITAQADALLNDESQAKLKCLRGFCPNLTVRHQLSRKSTKLVEEVVEHYEKRGLISQVSCGVLRKELWDITNRDYHDFQSRTSIVKEIMDGLKDSKIERMGVCGMGGVGKTTLVKEIYKQASEDKKLFDNVVILLDVKQNPDLEAIQKTIVDKLRMEILQDETIDGRAHRLCGRIQDKKILVILDDVEEKIDLEALGLPRLPTCKILLTCRTRQVFDEMRVDKVFQLDLLDKQDAWNLFVNIAGDVINQNGGIRDVAIQVAERCGGLPSLVFTVASALKQENKLHAWKDALRRLKGFDKEELKENAYLALEWSYNQLDDRELKPLFLLCGVIVKQNHIYDEVLLKYVLGLGLFKNVNTVEEARDSLYTLLEKLKDSCLLLDSDVDGKVRMHDLVCHVAKRIAYRDQHVLSVEYGGELKEWPHKDFLRRCTMISLALDNIPTLPEIPLECPELELFRLGGGDGESVEIPSNFFREMQKLKVLDLTGMRMPSLPLSLQYLKNLRTLCLDYCTLGDITLLGQLSNLEILSFVYSDVKELPKEIGQLTRLRLLDLSNCYQLEVISPTVISSLVRLEDLRMGNSFNKWEVEGERNNASLSELKHLFQLSALEIHIPNADVLPANLFSHKLERFNIFIGDAWVGYSWGDMAATTLNTLKLKLTKSIIELDEGLKLLLKRSEDLSLDETEVVIVNQLNTEDFEHLKHLQLQNSISTDIINRKVVLPNLSNLVLHECDGLRFMLSSSTARSLIQLEHLEISGCQMMEEIVSTEQHGEEITGNMFRQLQHLKLKDLPNFARFSSESFIVFSSLKTLKIVECAKLNKFIFDPLTKRIAIYKETEGGDLKENLQTVVRHFICEVETVVLPNLTSFVVHRLDGLSFLLSSSMARSIVQFRHREISECQIMEEIVSATGHGEENLDDMFSKLELLEQNYLPVYIEFPYIQGWNIVECIKLETVFDPVSKNIAIYKEIKETHSEENLESVVHSFLFDEKVVLRNITRLIIHNYHGLSFLLSSDMAKSLVQLKHVEISECQIMKEIVFLEECSEAIKDDMLPKLEQLVLKDLPNLTRFCPRMHAFNWPLLKTLELLHCRIVDIFDSGFSGLPKTPDLCNPVKQPFVLIKKSSFPNLEDLTLGPMDIWYGPPTPAAFCKQAVFPGIRGRHTDKTIPHLKTLRLHGMEKLMRLWGENTEPAGPVFLQLKTLELKFCGLNNIELSAISFKNLKILEVSFCWRLQFLTTYSVAQSLGQLKKLKVDECKSMKEILANDGVGEDASNSKIVFSQLRHLELSDLISLERFCSRNCIVKVPLLETSALEVNCCSIKLKISSDQTLEEVDSKMHLDVQKSHSRKEEAGATTEAAGILETNQKQPSPNVSEGAQDIEAVTQETAINSQNMEHAKVTEPNQKQVVTNTLKNLQEADFGMQEIQPLNLGSREGKQFQFQADSGSQLHSQYISKLEAEIRHLQEELSRAKEAEMRDKEQKLAEERLASVDPKGS